MEVELDTLIALSKLPERQREIVVDHVFCGLSLEKIATRDKVSRQSVQTRFWAGAATLALELGLEEAA